MYFFLYCLCAALCIEKRFPQRENRPVLFIPYRALFLRVRKQRDMPCTLDRGRKLSLVPCAVAGYPSGQYLSSLGDILPKKRNILIIYRFVLTTEYTDLFSPAYPASSLHRRISSVIVALRSIVSHTLFLLICADRQRRSCTLGPNSA